MPHSGRPIEEILADLQERAKELKCLYRVQEILGGDDIPRVKALQELVEAIPAGWQFPESCHARLEVDGMIFETPGFRETIWNMEAPLVVQGEPAGRLTLYYDQAFPAADEGPFLAEERKLLNTIAERINGYLLNRHLRRTLAGFKGASDAADGGEPLSWNVVFDFLRRTDPGLLLRITRKMINHLCWEGIREGPELLRRLAPLPIDEDSEESAGNRPARREAPGPETDIVDETFRVAAEHLDRGEIIEAIHGWINEDKTGDLASVLERKGTTLSEILVALNRYRIQNLNESELPGSVRTELRVSLARRFFSEHLEYLSLARELVDVGEIADLVQRIVATERSHGKLGGKSAGLFLASQIIRREAHRRDSLREIRIPRTWYVASDTLLEFVHHNTLEELFTRKYMDIDRVRQDYPYTIQLLKNSRFPPEIVKGLSVALDDLGKVPLIVRSSSLLEDQTGAAFSGKYKSLFLANRGTKKERLAALIDAIAEVYASIFGPDPIEYRAERGLLDVHEEMAIMIQAVVGRRAGDWFLPAYSGVAFSNNEFRWSARISREDGLVRLVPGLGTRAVDRVGDDFPVLAAPGQSKLRVNATVKEIVRYSPRFADVIDLKRNRFATVDMADLLADIGRQYPMVRKVVSRFDGERLTPPSAIGADFSQRDWIVTFEGLFRETPFLEDMRILLDVLREGLDRPVDIEFAHDGDFFHLLQCRPQSFSSDVAPAAIPQDIPRADMLFTASRYVSNGRVPEITHIVYVDPDAYAQMESLEGLKSVARAVGRLNQMLPKRKFVLMGPGRWGSRGDPKLGVGVTYSDINNTAVLIEIARQKGGYVPDLSFGTHFFQDLVEEGIRYLPLYPDDDDIAFQEAFFRGTRNVLGDLLPQCRDLESVVRVIDVPRETDGRILRILMNADLDRAVGFLSSPGVLPVGEDAIRPAAPTHEASAEDQWRWRLFMAERIARETDPIRFGVRAMWVIGSTKNANAGPASDIDLIIHIDGDPARGAELRNWLEGWSRALAQMNFLRTGYETEGLLDVHYLTDADFEARTSFAAKIGAVTDPARPLPLGNDPRPT